MKRALVVVAVLAASVACGTSGHKPDTAACRAALLQEVKVSMATGQEGKEPASCHGLDKKTLSRISGEVINEAVKEALSND